MMGCLSTTRWCAPMSRAAPPTANRPPPPRAQPRQRADFQPQRESDRHVPWPARRPTLHTVCVSAPLRACTLVCLHLCLSSPMLVAACRAAQRAVATPGTRFSRGDSSRASPDTPPPPWGVWGRVGHRRPGLCRGSVRLGLRLLPGDQRRLGLLREQRPDLARPVRPTPARPLAVTAGRCLRGRSKSKSATVNSATVKTAYGVPHNPLFSGFAALLQGGQALDPGPGGLPVLQRGRPLSH